MSIAPNDVVRPINRLLKIAVVGGVEMAVRLHIERGDELNSRDDMGSTPLMLAAARNRAGICRLLIDAGADMLALDPAGNDALAIAKAAGAIDAASVIESAQAIRRAQNVRCERIEEPDRVVDKVSEPVVVLPETRDCAGASDASLSGRVPSAEEQEMHDGASHCGGSLLSPPAPTAGLRTPATHTGFPTIETEDEASAFDVSGWETEDLLPPPTGCVFQPIVDGISG